MLKALVVDDEKLIVKGIKFSLEQDGYQVDCAYDGESALEMAKKTEYDVVLLDLMLPNMDGLQVCQAIREFSSMPIIMVTAKDSDMDKILGLEYGADDYITKPFNILEVKARIKAIQRRDAKSKAAKEADSSRISAGELEINTDSRTVKAAGRDIELTAKEFDILMLMASNPDKVYSRDQLLKLIWGDKVKEESDERTVDVHVRRLREKIEPVPSTPTYIHTKWGVGYYFSVNNKLGR